MLTQKKPALWVVLALVVSLPISAAELSVPPSGRTGLAVTIHNGDLALVRDSRRVRLPSGDADLAFADVSMRMQPNTAFLRSSAGSFIVREKVFDFDVVSQSSLLRASVGQEVSVIRVNPTNGRDIEARAKVLAVANGVVLEIDGRITTEIPGRLVFDALPPGVRTQATLLAGITSEEDGEVEVDLSYLTKGLTWRADYVAELSSDRKTIDLVAWATISNTTGTDYPAATVKLVSGDVNLAPGQPTVMRAMDMARSAAMSDSIMPKSLAAFHLYAIDKPVTLVDRQTKQLALLSADTVGVRMDLMSRSDGIAMRGPMNGKLRTSQVTRSLVFDNTKDQGLGTPLPPGTVRVYGQDPSGARQFLGEGGVEHTPKGQEAQFTLGRDFDVTVVREQTEFLRASERIIISAHRVTVSNAKAEKVRVHLVENLIGDWEVVDQSLPHTKVQGNAEWTVYVPAGGELQVDYRVRLRL
ncbi:MAG: DUF4139 domain-containing protein [Rhodospirillaceae bacterium]|nr:DUF4139 domain-containing protein [Rhodospirillaceae bacterium]